MRRWIRWCAMGLGAVAVISAVAVLVGWKLAQHKMDRVVEIRVKPVPYMDDARALERGKYLFESRGCVECHGATGGGRMFVDDGKGLRIAGPDITAGGATLKYQPVDWVRAIRHGIKPNGRPAMIMPSEDFNRFTDADLAALVGYVRSLPPNTGSAAVLDLPLVVRVMYGLGLIQDAAQKINHSLSPAEPVPIAVNAQHGAYVANMCVGCHGDGLSGGKIPGGPPDWPAAGNLTSGEGSAMARYRGAEAFVTMLRTGRRPDGSKIKVMPFESLAKINDVDAMALYEYLGTVPARPFGQR